MQGAVDNLHTGEAKATEARREEEAKERQIRLRQSGGGEGQCFCEQYQIERGVKQHHQQQCQSRDRQLHPE